MKFIRTLVFAAPLWFASLGAQATELLPRADIFGNPERASAEISPDGRMLAFLAPRDGPADCTKSTSAPSRARSHDVDGCHASSQISAPARPKETSKARMRSPAAKSRPSSNIPYVGR